MTTNGVAPSYIELAWQHERNPENWRLDRTGKRPMLVYYDNLGEKQHFPDVQNTPPEIRKHFFPNDSFNEPDIIEITKEVNLDKVLEMRDFINQRKKSRIQFQQPVIVRTNTEGEHLPVIYPRTINLIQGKTARHKSRLVEILCAAILNKSGFAPDNKHLGFVLNDFSHEHLSLLYCDTERNVFDQFPAALQTIQTQAGHPHDTDLLNFDFISLLSIEREQRFSVFADYLEMMREKHRGKHVFVVLDVVTDLIGSFNDVRESMRLVDLLNATINHHDVTFFVVIHENPSSESNKARGHIGSELSNKASTIIGLDFVKDSDNNETDTLCIRFIKCRSSKRHNPFYAVYDESLKSLIETEKPQYKENREEQKRDTVRTVFKGVRMTRKGFARDYNLLRGLNEKSKQGFNVFSEALATQWIILDSEKSNEGEELFWFTDDKPKEPEQYEILP